LALKKCFNPTIIIAIVVGAYFAMIGDALVSFEARQKPAMMQPFVKFDAGMTDALVEFNNFPITVANFSYKIGASAAAGLDHVLVEINNYLANNSNVYILDGIICGDFTRPMTSLSSGSTVNIDLQDSHRSRAFHSVCEEKIFSEILSIQASSFAVSYRRDAYESLGMPNASALGIPLYQFATVKVADEMFSVVFALTNIIGSIFLIIGVVLLVMAILQIASQFARPFVVGQVVVWWLEMCNLLREGIYVVHEAACALAALAWHRTARFGCRDPKWRRRDAHWCGDTVRIADMVKFGATWVLQMTGSRMFQTK
jgi:hypothetical protein